MTLTMKEMSLAVPKILMSCIVLFATCRPSRCDYITGQPGIGHLRTIIPAGLRIKVLDSRASIKAANDAMRYQGTAIGSMTAML